MEEFPTIASLAAADEQAVLRLWQGLGYYSRARNLRRAAGEVCERFEGNIPSELSDLRTLPGIGRYTAGAIASIAHDQPVPLVDANVARVICRLDLIRDDPKSKAVQDHLWRRAGELVPGKRAGDFNSALMELGALICLPRNPQCDFCPVRAHCKAAQAGEQDLIPQVQKRRRTPLIRRAVICFERDGRWLIEQRPSNGRWGGMWQFTTFPSPLKLLPEQRACLRKLGVVRHALTHRRYIFTAYYANREWEIPNGLPQRWVKAAEITEYPMSKPQRAIGELLRLGKKMGDNAIELVKSE